MRLKGLISAIEKAGYKVFQSYHSAIKSVSGILKEVQEALFQSYHSAIKRTLAVNLLSTNWLSEFQSYHSAIKSLFEVD